MTGRAGIPATGVSSVVLNVTVTEPSAGGWLTVFPSGATRPLASSINFSPGQTIANAVVVKVGTDGAIDIYNFQGSTHVVLDVQGWFGSAIADAGARYTLRRPVAHSRHPGHHTHQRRVALGRSPSPARAGCRPPAPREWSSTSRSPIRPPAAG